MSDPEAWMEERQLTLQKEAYARLVLDDVRQGKPVLEASRRHPLPGGGYVSKSILVAVYRQLVANGEWPDDPAFLARIRMKPVRSLSGVTTVTVLTKPYPCPGRCIFCPEDTRMPKSYLPDEPGAARAFQNQFDPYRQVKSRLDSYDAVGHPTDKIELLILGGSWTVYPRAYQKWFIGRCFDAMNGQAEEKPEVSLETVHEMNEDGLHRNVGLVIETRPDEITPEELVWLRSLGVTKVQMGVQSLDDDVLAANRRGHTALVALRATTLLRAAGFKIVLHWMPNLLKATPESDREDFLRLFASPQKGQPAGFCPDEIKIYPTQLLENTELYTRWQAGEYRPYETQELIDLIADVKPAIPVYCRVNRVIRDIPSSHVVEGNRRTSLRQDVLEELARRGQRCRCIRCREVREQQVAFSELTLEDAVYQAACAEEHFLSFVTPEDQIAGYLRLSLPHPEWAGQLGLEGESLWRSWDKLFPELRGAGLVREVHVYGQSLAVGAGQQGAAQHIGLGTQLLERASQIARQQGYSRLAVIAAVGTRKYYQKRGFKTDGLYMIKDV
jgi:elongator complex protein 3